MSPLTRGRSPEHIPDAKVVEYYAQRATPGGLLISEATNISVMAGNYVEVPGIFTPEQRRAWKKVTDAVHAKGGYIYCQLWHVGRTTHPDNIGGRRPFGPSANKQEGGIAMFTRKGIQPTVVAQEMTVQDIKETIEDYAHAAKYAIEAGFDGVELHAANGYLPDQFLCDAINERTDEYGGSIQNRARFALEVLDAIIKVIGSDRTGIRISPFSGFQGQDTSDILGDYGYLVEQCDKLGLAFIELVEPRSDLFKDESQKMQHLYQLAEKKGLTRADVGTLRPFRMRVKNTPFLVGGGLKPNNILDGFKEDGSNGDAVLMGRYFISNPDIVERLRKGLPLTHYDRKTFYTNDEVGYTDYRTYEEEKGSKL